jgi:hypothetical protein
MVDGVPIVLVNVAGFPPPCASQTLLPFLAGMMGA